MSAQKARALDDRELMAELGISSATFYREKKAGTFNRFRLPFSVGNKRWSRALVDRFLDGESVTAFGRGARLLRRGA